MTTIQPKSSWVKWVNNVKDETHQLLKRFNQEGKERASDIKRNASAVKLFLDESEKGRLTIHRETMVTINGRLRHIREEEKAIIEMEKAIIKSAHDLMRKISEGNKELAGGVRQFLTRSETERQTDYKAMMARLYQSIKEIRERTKEVRRESIKLLENLAGENGTLRTEMKKFLNESEATRKKDFNKIMDEVKAVLGEIRSYESKERRLAGAGTKEPISNVEKKKEITREAKPEKKTTDEGREKVEIERKKHILTCQKCGTRHWPFQKCPKGKVSFEKEGI